MTAVKMTIKEATEKWVMRFNSIPQNIIVKLCNNSEEELAEITPSGTDEHDGFLPMWGTMWSFRDDVDNWWLENEENMKAMAECGFRIYDQEDYGYVFGVDGAGYDFYEAHWIPLYKARGLCWHCD